MSLARRFVELLAPLLPTQEQHLAIGLDIWRRHTSLGSFDAVLAATTLASGVTLVSAERAFARVQDLDHVQPDEKGVARLLA